MCYGDIKATCFEDSNGDFFQKLIMDEEMIMQIEGILRDAITEVAAMFQ